MSERRYWLSVTKSQLTMQSVPAEIFDQWSATAMTREQPLVVTTRFGVEQTRRVNVARYEAGCSDIVSGWLKQLTGAEGLQGRRIKPDLVLPPEFPLRLILASDFETVYEVMPALIRFTQALVRPSWIVLDCRLAGSPQQQCQNAHKILAALVRHAETQSACFGPVAVAEFPA